MYIYIYTNVEIIRDINPALSEGIPCGLLSMVLDCDIVVMSRYLRGCNDTS